MRRIERTSQFKRDYKREAKGPHRVTFYKDLTLVPEALAFDQLSTTVELYETI
jgi:mRNA interferase YafQ